MTKALAPAAERNRQPIVDLLRRVLPADGLVLEVASGTGQHAEFFSETLPALRWQPSDISAQALESIRTRVRDAARENLLAPLELDVREMPWPVERSDAILCINMIHIAPWEATVALFRGAAGLLDPNAPLITYGPYRLHGQHTSFSNQAFDETLRSRNPAWGVRDIDALSALAGEEGFVLDARFEMPANNMTLCWRRTQ